MKKERPPLTTRTEKGETTVSLQERHNTSPRGMADTSKKKVHELINQFNDLAEKSLVGIYLIQDDIFRYVNPRFAEIFGYGPEEIIDIVKPEALVLSEDWPVVRENLRRRIIGESESFHYEFRGVTKEHQVVHVEVYGSRTEREGRPAVIGTLIDISQRVQTEQTLKLAEAKYRNIFENAVEGIFQTTPKGQFVVANPMLSRMLGYDSPEELIDSFKDIESELYVDPSRRLEFMEKIQSEGFVLGFGCELRKKDGGKLAVVINARDVRDESGTSLYYEGIIEDITERKKVEDALSRLNELNRAIIENAPVAIFTLDKDGIFTSVNPSLGALSDLGTRMEEKLIGFNWLTNHYTIQCGLAKYIEKGLEGEAFQLWDFPFVNYRGNRSLYMDFKGVPLKGNNGDVEGLLCIIEETTDRVKTRAKLMQEGKMSAIGRLAAGVAHELNNPLATLVAYVELSRDLLKIFPEYGERQGELDDFRRYMHIIEEQAFRCKDAVKDILNLPRRDGMEMEPVDINQFLEDVVGMTSAGMSGVKIVIKPSPGLPQVRGDRRALRQVFVNIMNNGVEALEGRMDPTIWLRTGLKNDFVSVEIEDNGIGIPDSILEKVFEPFFTTKESQKGIGLGLSLSTEFVRDMGGSISVKSTPRYGTVFTVLLPTAGIGH